jgi:hypothetical protein
LNPDDAIRVRHVIDAGEGALRFIAGCIWKTAAEDIPLLLAELRPLVPRD